MQQAEDRTRAERASVRPTVPTTSSCMPRAVSRPCADWGHICLPWLTPGVVKLPLQPSGSRLSEGSTKEELSGSSVWRSIESTVVAAKRQQWGAHKRVASDAHAVELHSTMRRDKRLPERRGASKHEDRAVAKRARQLVGSQQPPSSSLPLSAAAAHATRSSARRSRLREWLGAYNFVLCACESANEEKRQAEKLREAKKARREEGRGSMRDGGGHK